MTQNDLSTLIISAKGMVEEIARIEIKIRTPISWIAIILLITYMAIYINTFILVFLIAIIIGSIYMIWGYKKYQTIYYGKTFGVVNLWHMLFWRTYLRNVQKHYSEAHEFYPYVISNALLIINDIKAYLKFKWTNMFLGTFIIILLSVQMTFLDVPTDNLSDMWPVMIFFYIIIFFIELVTLTFLHIRFRETKARLKAFKSQMENFWRYYW